MELEGFKRSDAYDGGGPQTLQNSFSSESSEDNAWSHVWLATRLSVSLLPSNCNLLMSFHSCSDGRVKESIFCSPCCREPEVEGKSSPSTYNRVLLSSSPTTTWMTLILQGI